MAREQKHFSGTSKKAREGVQVEEEEANARRMGGGRNPFKRLNRASVGGTMQVGVIERDENRKQVSFLARKKQNYK